jgi:hypothetical protein
MSLPETGFRLFPGFQILFQSCGPGGFVTGCQQLEPIPSLAAIARHDFRFLWHIFGNTCRQPPYQTERFIA